MTSGRVFEDGNKIVFLGDSITQAADGYVKIVEEMLGALVPDARITCINAGIGGNKVTDMLERIGEDVIVHDPDWITVSVGINDVWHGINGTQIDVFKDRYDELVRRLADQTVAKLALFTTTIIGEDPEAEANKRLMEYNDFIRHTARKRNALLVPMNEEFHEALLRRRRIADSLHFTTDDVHMAPAGNYLMAITLLRSWGLL